MFTSEMPTYNVFGMVDSSSKLPVVGVRTFHAIVDIDDVNHKFTLDFELFFQWKDPRNLNSSNEGDFEDIPAPEWVPNFYITDTAENKVLSDFTYKKRGGWYFGEVNWLITINDPFDVHYFPFDRQILDAELTCSNAEMKSYDVSKGLPVGYKSTFTNATTQYKFRTWVLEKFDVVFGSRNGLSRCTQSIYITRDAEFYLANIIFIMFILVLVSASIYIVDVNDLGSRISILITSILTAVAFKFVTITFVPQVPYMTTLDKYNLLCFAALGILIIKCVVIHYIDDEQDKQDFNDDFIYGYVIIWVGFHIIIWIGSKNKLFSESWDNVHKSNSKPPVILVGNIRYQWALDQKVETVSVK